MASSFLRAWPAPSQPVAEPAHRLSVLAVLWLGAAGAAQAQGTPAFLITPSATISEIVTSNAGLSGKSDAVTQGTLGLNLRSRSGQSQTSVDYSLSGLAYARQSELNSTQQSLNATLNLEWWERQGFLQASARISQGAISAFGAQPSASSLPTSNSTEVRAVQISPRWQGPLFGDLRFSAQADVGATDAQGSAAGDSTNSLIQLQIGPNRPGPVGWSIQASRQGGDFKSSTSTGSTRVFGSVSRAFTDLDLQWSANTGYERGNVVSGEEKTSNTWGTGVSWAPSPRTSADLKYDRRLFGNSHAVTLQHRTPLTVWRFASTRTLNQTGSTVAAGGFGTIYDLFFAQFASIEPDPVRRADLVNAFLANNGLSGASPVNSGFLRAASTIDNRQEISAAWRGVRSTATLTYGRTQSRRVNPVLNAADDLAASDSVLTTSWSLAASHRLTPELSAGASATLQSGRGAALGQSNRQRSFSAQIGGPLGPKSNWNLVLRRALNETQFLSSGESAAIASYTVRF